MTILTSNNVFELRWEIIYGLSVNHWTKLSIEYANQRNYLDSLFTVYPTIPEGIRDIDENKWKIVEKAFKANNAVSLIQGLLDLDLFPIKDSYVAYLKRDSSSIQRNPETIKRLSGRLYELGLDKIYERCSEPKETNRQIGPLFRRWLARGIIGADLLNVFDFRKTKSNAILHGSDGELMGFAREYLNYSRDKGLDFVGRFNGTYVIGEAKFLTDFGGHQNAQFNDAIAVLECRDLKAIPIAILDGVVYIEGNNKMFKATTEIAKKHNIMSALVLREFLYQI